MDETENLFTQPELNLNLGCGYDLRDDCINIDLIDLHFAVTVADARKLEYSDKSVDAILAQNLLECLPQKDLLPALKEWNRVLKIGGDLVIQVPVFRLINDAYQSGEIPIQSLSRIIFGENRDDESFNKSVFDERYLKKQIEKAGFRIIGEAEIVDILKQKYDIRYTTVKTEDSQVFPEFEQNQLNFDFAYIWDIQSKLKAAEPGSVYSDKAILNIVWEGAFYGNDYNSKLNRELCRSLDKSGIAEMNLLPADGSSVQTPENDKYDDIYKMDVRFKPKADDKSSKLPYFWVRNERTPKGIEPRGANWIIFQPWQFNTLPLNFIETYCLADAIWTCTEFSRKAFISAGIDEKRVHLIPIGINPAIFSPEGEKYNIPSAKKIKFVFVGQADYFSGIDLLIKSFNKTFTSNDDVSLIIKDTKQNSGSPNTFLASLMAEASGLPNSPEIIVMEQELDEMELASLYRSCNVFVSPFRALDCPLHQLEAISCGLTLIHTESKDLIDFVDNKRNIRISASKESYSNIIDNQPFAGEIFLFLPDSDELGRQMKSVYSEPSKLNLQGIINSGIARELNTWEHSASAVLSAISSSTNVLDSSLLPSHSNTSVDKYSLLNEIIEGNSPLQEQEKLTFLIDFSAELKVKSKLSDLTNLLLCRTYIKLNQFENAEQMLKQFDGNSYPADTLFLESELNEARSEWQQAINHIDQVLLKWDEIKYDVLLGFKLEDCLTRKGNLNLKMNDFSSGMSAFSEALRLNPDNAEAIYGTAFCLVNVGAEKEAKHLFAKVLRLNPDFKPAFPLPDSIK